MVYTRVLTLHKLSSFQYYQYLVLYNIVYVVPLAIIVAVITVTLGTRKLTEWQGRQLKLVSGLMMLALGAVLIEYKWIVVLFGVFLIATGVKMLFAPEKGLDPEKNPLIRLFRRFVHVSPEFHGQRFFLRLDGRLHATPLFVALLFVEVTDIIFAVDSVPAIYALTQYKSTSLQRHIQFGWNILSAPNHLDPVNHDLFFAGSSSTKATGR
jgi:uncharacterized membrane protein YfcA